MADKTKADLEAELNEVVARNQELEQTNLEYKNQLSTRIDVSWYDREIERLTKKSASAEGDLKALKDRVHIEAIERETIARDKAEKDARELAPYNVPEQSAHTRFRIYEKAPAGGRDIFGDPESAVFDLGVQLSNYYGEVYVPVAVIVEAGLSMGMLTREQAESIQNELATTKSKVDSAANLAQELSNGISELVDSFYYGLDNVVPTGDHNGKAAKSADSNTDSNVGQSDGSESNGESAGVSAGSNDTESNGGEAKQSSLFDSL